MQDYLIQLLYRDIALINFKMNTLENKNSEAGFREQFELYQLRLKEEEKRKFEEEERQK